MQVFIIHFTSLPFIVNHLKTIPSPVQREKVWEGNSAAFMNLVC